MSIARLTPLAVAALLSALVCVPAATAIVVYQDDFSEAAGTIMDGKSLDVALGVRGGTAGATWDATDAPVPDGNPSDLWETTGSNTVDIGTSGADSTIIENNLLPFTPVSGQLYDLHIELSPSGEGASGNWLGVAFHEADYNGHPPGGASSALSNDDPYGLIIAKGTGQVQSFAGIGTANGRINTATGFITPDTFTAFDILLDTRPAQWTIDWLIDGSPVSGAKYTYASNPSIGLLSFGTNKLAGSAQNFYLTAVPEPASVALALLGLVGLVGLARRR
jgi:hypothetical protein